MHNDACSSANYVKWTFVHVYMVSPSMQSTLHIHDRLLAMTVVNNSLQELASSVSHEDTQEVEGYWSWRLSESNFCYLLTFWSVFNKYSLVIY